MMMMAGKTYRRPHVSVLWIWTSIILWSCEAALVSYDFNVTWVTSNPDGALARPTMGINGQWPIPAIHVAVGDRVVIRVRNELGNQSTSLHFHGLYMNGTAHMDGPSQVSQCAIPPGSSFQYDFNITQPGTYWYHSHTDGQYPDGLRGPFIVHDAEIPFRYDDEVVLSMSDWYHEQMANLLPAFISRKNPTGAEPVPQSALFNDGKNVSVPVAPGKTYLFRLVNMAAFAGQYFWFEGHNMTIIEVDGIYTQPAEAQMLYVSSAQRYSFLLTTKNDSTTNYAFVGSMDTSLFDAYPSDLDYNVTGWLVYDAAAPAPAPQLVDEFEPFDDMTLLPYDNQTLLPEPDQRIQLDVAMNNLGDGANYAFFNNITWKAPIVPSLYTALSAGDKASNPLVYGSFSNSFVLKKDQIVEIVVNNYDDGRHPFHLHGHSFQAVYRSEESAGPYNASNTTVTSSFSPMPMRRDTIVLYPLGNMVLRFRSDNPGIWLFHCHIEWHVASGLIATLVEAPMELQRSLKIPQNHWDACAAGAVRTTGNAAGNTVDLLDLTGEHRAPDPLPDGFTTRGKVGLAFSILSGLLGTAVVACYGLAPDPASRQKIGPVRAVADGHADHSSGHSSPMAQASEPILIGASTGNGSARGV